MLLHVVDQIAEQAAQLVVDSVEVAGARGALVEGGGGAVGVVVESCCIPSQLLSPAM